MSIDPRIAPVGRSAEVTLEGARARVSKQVYDLAEQTISTLRKASNDTLELIDEKPLPDFDPTKPYEAVIHPLIAYMTLTAGVERAQRAIQELTSLMETMKALDPEAVA